MYKSYFRRNGYWSASTFRREVVYETSFVANLKTIFGFVHNLAICEKLNATSLSPGDFELILHGSECATSRFDICSECSPGFLQ